MCRVEIKRKITGFSGSDDSMRLRVWAVYWRGRLQYVTVVREL